MIANSHLFSMSDLESLKLKPYCVLLIELNELFIRIEGWSCKLLTPPWSMVFLEIDKCAASVRVIDHILIVDRLAESPDTFFIQAVIDHRNVGVRWVRVERLTLSVVEVKLFISVSDGQQV